METALQGSFACTDSMCSGLARLSVREVGTELHSYSTRASVCGHGQVEGRDVCGSDLVENHGSKTPLRAVRTILACEVHWIDEEIQSRFDRQLRNNEVAHG